MINKTKNFRFYNLYKNDNCVNCKIFFENVKKYSNQLLVTKVINPTGISDGRY